jgi:hypothetical protein
MRNPPRSEADVTLSNAARATPRESFRDDHSGDARQTPRSVMADEISDAAGTERLRQRHRLQNIFASRATLRQAILLTEILGRPKGL